MLTAARPPLLCEPGEKIGPFRLVRKLGDGGMGEVREAEQMAPVRRTVALKLLKPGMDTRQIVARFEAERQVLALMQHPDTAQAKTLLLRAQQVYEKTYPPDSKDTGGGQLRPR